MRIYGVDFTCAPRRAKPITVAVGSLRHQVLEVESVERLESFVAFEALLSRSGPWVGGFDFPFSLPSELVRDLGWPADWKALVRHCAAMPRQDFRQALDAYRSTRPVGRRYAHRATDLPAGSSSPMKLVNPPVALMFHEGAPRLAASGICVPPLIDGSEQTPARAAARGRIVRALKAGRPLGVKLKTRADLVADGSGDTLDAAICAVQAAWAAGRPGYGIPDHVPEAEGWIIAA